VAVAFAIGLLDIGHILDIYGQSRTEIVARANEPGWDLRTKLLVATTIFSPIGWCSLAGLAAYLFARGRNSPWLPIGLILLSLVPFFYTMLNLLTPKYVIPVLVLYSLAVGIACVDWLGRLRPSQKSAFVISWVSLTILSMAIAIEPDNNAPYLRATVFDARQISTHDGERSWGAYVSQFASVERKAQLSANQESARSVLEWARSDARDDLWIAGETNFFSDGGMGWRHLYILAAKKGYQTEQIDRATVRFNIAGTSVYLATDVQSVPQAACLWDLSGAFSRDSLRPPACLRNAGFQDANP
jgi:hypothetical protein